MQLTVFSIFIATLAGFQLFMPPASAEGETPVTLNSDSPPVAEFDMPLATFTEHNTALATELSTMANELGLVYLERTVAEAERDRIQADYSDAKATLKTVGRVDKGLGPLLRQHHDSLPDSRYYALRIKRRARQISELGVRQMLRRDEHRRMADTGNTAIELQTQSEREMTPADRETLGELIQQRQSLLDKALQQDKLYLESLQQLDNSERELLIIINDYDQFLRQHLWWLRGAEPTNLDDIRTAVASIGHWQILSSWQENVRASASRMIRSPFIWLSALIAGVVTLKRRTLIAAIQACSEELGRVSTDRLSNTFKALVWTMIIALPLPIVLLVVSWQLIIGTDQLAMAVTPDASLLHLCGLLYLLKLLRWICIPGGLADAHFRWSAQDLSRLRRELSRLTWIYVPTSLGVWIVYTRYSLGEVGVVSRLGFLLFHIVLCVSLYRLLHRKHGAIGTRFQQSANGVFYHLYPLGFWILVLLPVWLGIDMLGGYVHSSIAVSGMLLSTLGLGIVLVILNALARRWLLVVHRRLAYEAALERRRTMLAARQAKASGEVDAAGAELILEEPEVNLTELSEDTRGLIGVVVLIIALVGLYFIWMPIYPALKVFENVNLWYRSVTIDGEVQNLPTTLADMGQALLIVVTTTILVTRLPSVLEFILLQRSSTSEGDRYTLKKLTTYSLVAIGSLLSLNTLGANWSQLQWLVAALGVGIGFGLQEIVANFISGLIILFERPIRIGDVVTIDDTSGIVTKIRIRATTIRDWDRKELLVPNKDLITGRVLNWSLSDEMTRIVITVGVAYDTDVDNALELMKVAATEHEHALQDPAPLLSFDRFGDNAIILTMRVYVSSISHRIKTMTDLHKAINTKFQQAGITIAYPQSDVHVNSRDPLRVSIENANPAVTVSNLTAS